LARAIFQTRRSLMPKVSAMLAVFSVLLVASTESRADNTTCGSAILAVPDGSLHQGDLSNTAPNRWFRFVGKTGRSYAVMLENLSPSDQQASIGLLERRAGRPGTSEYGSHLHGGGYASGPEATGRRRSLRAGGPAQHEWPPSSASGWRRRRSSLRCGARRRLRRLTRSTTPPTVRAR
jgi:hypothetical protein